MNLNDQYKADLAAHDAWMANSRKQSAEFEKTMRQIDADTALAENILAGVCQNCGEYPGVRFDRNYPVASIVPSWERQSGWVCQRCHELCSECGNHPSEGHETGCKSDPAAKCPGYGCGDPIGTDGGIIDGDRYCAGCVADEARETGREARRQDAELFARGGGDL